MMDQLVALQAEIEKGLQNVGFDAEPRSLYAPADYIIKLGGKRLRPALTLMACAFYTDPLKALPQALAVEVFHNFTLMHDDIMDDAPLRRGKKTVHEKWGLNTAILSGDAMLVRAYQLVAQADSEILPGLLQLFSQTAIEVCEGQQYDMDFQNRDDVSEDEYIRMIQLKTSVLLGGALQMGAIVAGAPKADAENLYQFGLLLGTSFQIKDDYLDVFGNPKKVGKQIGGDILADKKTLLWIRAKSLVGPAMKKWQGIQSSQKVEAVKAIYLQSGVDQYALQKSMHYYNLALDALDKLSVSSSKKEMLKQFAQMLLNRES